MNSDFKDGDSLNDARSALRDFEAWLVIQRQHTTDDVLRVKFVAVLVGFAAATGVAAALHARNPRTFDKESADILDRHSIILSDARDQIKRMETEVVGPIETFVSIHMRPDAEKGLRPERRLDEGAGADNDPWYRGYYVLHRGRYPGGGLLRGST